MKTFIAISAILAVAFADGFDQGVSLTQDTAGNYNLNYNTKDSRRSEQGFQGGKVVGSFSYMDKEGGHHTIKYVAAPDSGFIAEGDLPRPVHDTPEVYAARAAHLAIVEKERSILPHLPEEQHFAPQFAAPAQFVQHVPIPTQHYVIDNSAEIAAATAEHFAAHEKVLAELAEAYRTAPRTPYHF